MKFRCPHCTSNDETCPDPIRRGRFWRKSDGRSVQRFKCIKCCRGFSAATAHPCVGQKKRHLNERVRKLLCSGISQRRLAQVLKINRKTVVRKFLFLGQRAQESLASYNESQDKVQVVEFDELETIEHTKLKPVSVILAVQFKRRRILGLEVAQMPAKGRLARQSRKKYGRRVDGRQQARNKLFKKIKPLLVDDAIIKSDENPHYPVDVRYHFPRAQHLSFKGQRGSTTGQGELKKVRFDPLFSLNHTCAMLRANINRLFRKTWCTTKKMDRLTAHLAIYADFHNRHLISK